MFCRRFLPCALGIPLRPASGKHLQPHSSCARLLGTMARADGRRASRRTLACVRLGARGSAHVRTRARARGRARVLARIQTHARRRMPVRVCGLCKIPPQHRCNEPTLLTTSQRNTHMRMFNFGIHIPQYLTSDSPRTPECKVDGSEL